MNDLDVEMQVQFFLTVIEYHFSVAILRFSKWAFEQGIISQLYRLACDARLDVPACYKSAD